MKNKNHPDFADKLREALGIDYGLRNILYFREKSLNWHRHTSFTDP